MSSPFATIFLTALTILPSAVEAYTKCQDHPIAAANPNLQGVLLQSFVGSHKSFLHQRYVPRCDKFHYNPSTEGEHEEDLLHGLDLFHPGNPGAWDFDGGTDDTMDIFFDRPALIYMLLESSAFDPTNSTAHPTLDGWTDVGWFELGSGSANKVLTGISKQKTLSMC